jgi:hypothetical protein
MGRGGTGGNGFLPGVAGQRLGGYRMGAWKWRWNAAMGQLAPGAAGKVRVRCCSVRKSVPVPARCPGGGRSRHSRERMAAVPSLHRRTHR